MGRNPQLNLRLPEELNDWMADYEAATGLKSTFLARNLIEALFTTCGPDNFPKFPYNFKIECNGIDEQHALAAENDKKYMPAGEPPEDAPLSLAQEAKKHKQLKPSAGAPIPKSGKRS